MGQPVRYIATKHKVLDRGAPKDPFLDELIAWGKAAPDDIFAHNSSATEIYSRVAHFLGPWQGPRHRRAVMLEVMRVLAGFESSWDWNKGRNVADQKSNKPETMEAGAWQVSADSMKWGPELRTLVLAKAGSHNANDFRRAMKHNHPLAMEYIARLLRRTCKANGPVLHHHIDPWLRRDAVAEFLEILYPPGPPGDFNAPPAGLRLG